VKHLGCQCGIVLTASHNPPEYNGYKVYWQDGGQIVPPEDKGIIDVIENLNYDQIKFTANEDLIHYIDTAVDEALSNRLLKTQVLVLADAKKRTEYSFTSLHGTL
jgi:phosphomannomutase